MGWRGSKHTFLADYVIQAGAKIMSLGGFSSVLIEGNFDQLPERHENVRVGGPEPQQINAAYR